MEVRTQNLMGWRRSWTKEPHLLRLPALRVLTILEFGWDAKPKKESKRDYY